MAGDKIYVGAMLSDLQTKIDAMKLSMDIQSTLLDRVATTSGQSIQAMKLTGSSLDADIKITLGNFSTTGDYVAPGKLIYKANIFASGTIRLSVDTTTLSGGTAGTLGYSYDEGATKTTVFTVSTNATKRFFDIPLVANKTLSLYWQGGNGYVNAFTGMKIYYKLVDITLNNGVDVISALNN